MAIRRKIRSIDPSFEVLTLRNRLLQSFVCGGGSGVLLLGGEMAVRTIVYTAHQHTIVYIPNIYHKAHISGGVRFRPWSSIRTVRLLIQL